jgi:hypothetical protein
MRKQAPTFRRGTNFSCAWRLQLICLVLQSVQRAKQMCCNCVGQTARCPGPKKEGETENVKRNVMPEMLSTEMLLNLFKQNVLKIERIFVRLKVFFVRRKVLTSAGRILTNVL